MARVFLVFVALVVAVRLGGESPQSQTVAPATEADVNALIGQGESLLTAGKPAEAKPLFDRALAAARQLSLPNQEAAALCGLGNALHRTAQYQPAYDAAKQCLEQFERLDFKPGVARALLTLGAASEVLGRPAEARTHAERAIAAFDAVGNWQGRAAAILQFVRGNPRPPDTAKLLARVVDESVKAGDRSVEGQALHSWGDYLFSEAQYVDALDKLERAAQAFEAAGRPDAVGTVYNSIGRLYRAHGRLDEALRCQMKALELHSAGDASFELMQSLNAVGAVNTMMGNVRTARSYYERSLALALKMSSPRIQDFLRANIAQLSIAEGQFDQAALTLEDVLGRGLDAYPSSRYSHLSYAQLKLGRTDQALASADEALKSCRPATPECVAARSQRAAVLAARGDRTAALEDIDAALKAIEEIRTKLVPADFIRQEFHRGEERIYSRAIALKLSDGRAEEALETAEQARSRAFLDLLAARNLRAPSVDRAPGGAAAPATARGISALAERLRSTFVQYWLSEDELIIFVVKPDGRTLARRVNVLRSRVTDLVRATTSRGDSPASQPGAWRTLYDLLIAPIRADLPASPDALLTIVPDGPLNRLSFAALQDPQGRYLLEQYTLHYVPAAAVLQFTDTLRRPDARSGGVLLVADPVMPTLSRLDSALPRLPGARNEANAIAQIVPRARVILLTGAQATEPAILEALGDRRVVHFATHAVIKDDDPMASFLALGPVRGDPNGDGILTAQKVYRWNLHADLVVLSACQSAGGRITGDGIATFARAFIYAGTPTLVASIWDVADEPATRLLPAFYRRWLGGQTKARALRAAQLQLLADLRAGRVQIQTPAGLVGLSEHPVFWAGFAVIGEPD